MLPKTYRARLVAYILLLISFLAGTLIYSYHYSREALLQESRQQLTDIAVIDARQIERRNTELQRFVNLIADDTQTQEYLGFAILNGDSGPLQRLLEKRFSEQQAKRGLVLTSDGRTLLGGDHIHLVAEIIGHNSWQDPTPGSFYYQSPDELEFVAYAPVVLRGEVLGLVVMSHSVSKMLLASSNITDNDAYFIERGGEIQYSTIPTLTQASFFPQDDHININGDIYLTLPVLSIETSGGLTTIWRGNNETELLNSLIAQGQRIIGFAVAGVLLILLVGIVIIRSFNKPLSALVQLTEEVTHGHLPNVEKSSPRTEIDTLTNSFADMVQSLREKQSEVDKAQQALEKSAITDTLTGLYNRRHLLDIFPKLQAQAKRDNRIIIAILCDLDYFKQLNDRFGHMAGDKALQEFSATLQRQSRCNDFIYRMGGEEFLIITLGDEPSGGVALAEKIRAATREQVIVYKNQTINLTVSCGVSFSSPNEDPESSLNQLLSRADRALYQAKRRGRNQVRSYEDIDEFEQEAVAQANYQSAS